MKQDTEEKKGRICTYVSTCVMCASGILWGVIIKWPLLPCVQGQAEFEIRKWIAKIVRFGPIPFSLFLIYLHSHWEGAPPNLIDLPPQPQYFTNYWLCHHNVLVHSTNLLHCSWLLYILPIHCVVLWLLEMKHATKDDVLSQGGFEPPPFCLVIFSN